MSNTTRHYWLGHDKPSSQDTFFLEALDPAIWKKGSKDQWDTCWYTGMPNKSVFEQLDANKSINHISGNNALTLKNHLYTTLLSAKERLQGTPYEQRFDFFPETFSMPEDYFRFQQTALDEPDQLWIKKPKNLSRGRGIDMVRHPSTVPLDSEWIIQRYLSNPHLCQGRKYVLRCYVLITSIEPLRFYWYQDGFAKLASETYCADDLDNLYRHLTNPDVNEKNEEAESAVTFISFQKYREWLRSEGHDDEVFFNALKEMMTATVIAARESMRKRQQSIDSNTTGGYELIGLDCMVDDNIKPWIIECNLSPSLSTYADPKAGADDEVTAKRDMVKDLVNLIGLNNTTIALSDTEKAEQEDQQKGNFECLFPNRNQRNDLALFPVPRYADLVPFTSDDDLPLMSLTPSAQSDHTFSDSVAIFSNPSSEQFSQKTTQCIAPNEIATWVWLKISEGITPNDIINELAQALPRPDGVTAEIFIQQIATQVWDALADWSTAKVFVPSLPESTSVNIETTAINTTLNTPKKSLSGYVNVLDTTAKVNFFCDIAAHYLQHFYQDVGHTETGDENKLITVDIIPTDYGYSIIFDRLTIRNKLKLSELLPTLYRLLSDYITQKNTCTLLKGSLLSIEDRHVLIVNQNHEQLDAVAYQLLLQCKKSGRKVHLSNHCLLTDDLHVQPLVLPIKLPSAATIISTDDGSNLHQQVSIIAEEKPHSFHYIKSSETPHENISINKIIFINNTSSTSTEEYQPLNKSEALQKLWSQSDNHHHSQISSMAKWIETVESLWEVNSNDKNEDKTDNQLEWILQN